MIQINDKIRIVRIDDRNLQVEELRKVVNPKTKQERFDWCWVGYYGNLKTALSGVLTHLSTALVDEDLKGVQSVLDRLEDIRKDFINIIGE